MRLEATIGPLIKGFFRFSKFGTWFEHEATIGPVIKGFFIFSKFDTWFEHGNGLKK